MNARIDDMDDAASTTTKPATAMPAMDGVAKVRLILSAFGISLGQVVVASGRTISKSQLHRILNGQPPKPTERRAIAMALSSLIRERCDSAFLFDGQG